MTDATEEMVQVSLQCAACGGEVWNRVPKSLATLALSALKITYGFDSRGVCEDCRERTKSRGPIDAR